MYIQYNIHINPINDASIVATEAPNIPKLKTYIKIGSNIMFKIAVSINGFVALFTSPSALKILEVVLGSKNTIFNKNIIFP